MSFLFTSEKINFVVHAQLNLGHKVRPLSPSKVHNRDKDGDLFRDDDGYLQNPGQMGTTATQASQWWSDRSETPTDDGKHGTYDSEDERYFSDHFHRKAEK